MSPTTTTTVRIDDELLTALNEVKRRDGIPVSEQIRRAIQAWLESKDVSVGKSERKRVAARKRS